MKHVVQFSTGVGSAEVAWRVVAQYGADQVLLLTADTRKEHKDNWRFAREVADRLGCEWIVLADGRTPMQVGRDRKCVPNNRMAVCSQILKRELLRTWIDANCAPASTIIHLGFDWTEQERIAAAVPNWAPFRPAFVLAERPYVDKPDLLALFRSRGIEPPWLYSVGFNHANCSGGCVRGGQAQWELLLRVDPAEYADWEREEEETRDVLGKDVSILRDRSRGTTTPLTLRRFRERIQSQPTLFDDQDWGACGCFVGEAAS